MIPDAHSDSVLLAHILECIERIEEYTGGDSTAFLGLPIVRDAVLRNLQVLAESTQRLSEGVKATESDIPWIEIAGFRNVLAHNYLGISLEAVWTVIEQDLPQLARAIERMATRTPSITY